MTAVQNNLTETQTQLAQGKQLINPSDAPDQAANIQRIKSLLSKQESYMSSLNTVKTRLESEDTTLKGVTDMLIRAKELSIQSANGTLTSLDRKPLAAEMQSLRDEILSLANTKDNNGNYIYSGSRVKTAPFASDSNGSSDYQGDQTKMYVRVSEQLSIPLNRSGTDAFTSVNRTTNGITTGVGFFQVLDDLTTSIKNSDSAGMQRGMGEIDKLIDGVTLAHANVGTDLNVIDQQTSVIDDTVINLKSTLSSVEDLDYNTAITKMNQQMLSLQAAQSSFAKISQMSLFDFIR
jgi:flagellar hook-associated protein 3 FlgL